MPAADPRPVQPDRDPRRLRARAPAAKIAAWQSGVYEAKAANAELFAFTLDKSSGGFSPTTRYRDYAISRTLIHWESQSVTRADSATGLRYRNHERDGRTHPAVHPPPRRRPSLLVPRPRHLSRSRRRAADGDHLGAGAPALRRPLPIVRRSGGLTTTAYDVLDGGLCLETLGAMEHHAVGRRPCDDRRGARLLRVLGTRAGACHATTARCCFLATSSETPIRTGRSHRPRTKRRRSRVFGRAGSLARASAGAHP